MLRAPAVVFSDLDGTLLDSQTYSPSAAREAVAALERRHIPLVFCTSKTRAEVEPLRRRLNNKHPFIVENGGGIFIPRNYFPARFRSAISAERRPAGRQHYSNAPERWTSAGRYHFIALGHPYSQIIKLLDRTAGESGIPVIGFHHLSARGVAQLTGLPLEDARHALARQFDEPFFFPAASDQAKEEFAEHAKSRALQLTRGDRLWHVSRGSDKGRAVRLLTQIYQAALGHSICTIGLGDGSNDLPMLGAVDLPVLLPGRNGTPNKSVLTNLPDVRLADAPGPEGWKRAVFDLLKQPAASNLQNPKT